MLPHPSAGAEIGLRLRPEGFPGLTASLPSPLNGEDYKPDVVQPALVIPGLLVARMGYRPAS